MKYAVVSSLRLLTPSKQSTIHDAIMAKIAGKKVWGETISLKRQDENGNPAHNLEIRFDSESDMDDTFAFIKDKIDKIPVLKGTVTKHLCYHDEVPPRPCVPTESFTK